MSVFRPRKFVPYRSGDCRQIPTSIALRPDILERLEQIASSRGCSRSLLISEAIELWLEQQPEVSNSNSAEKIAA